MEIRNKARFYLARLREHLWLKPLISCVLSLLAAFVAGLADKADSAAAWPDISSESIEALLSIISSSMLVIAVFAVGAMLSAYGSASNRATPRSFPLVVSDDVSQNALSTFIGAFIFGIVAQIAVQNSFYEQPGRFVLFCITIFVFILVILSFVRWVDRIARLGRMGNTIEKVELAADTAFRVRAKAPTLGAKRATAPGHGRDVHSETVGNVQNIDMALLQRLAERVEGVITVYALPGAFVTPARALACIATPEGGEKEDITADIASAFVIGDSRTFESDPRFGLIVLSEIASRALSPAVNDPGTGIDVLGAQVRLLTRWHQACSEQSEPDVLYDRVYVPALSTRDLFDDAFTAIARDGASSVALVIRLQKALRALGLIGNEEMKAEAASVAGLSLQYAEQTLTLPQELDVIRPLAEENIQMGVPEA